jgi:hypothetical protein
MKHFILFIIILPFIVLNAQQPIPGGVSGAYIWEITENKLPDRAQWKSNLKNTPDTSLSISGKSKTINNNPALFLNANSINNSLNLGKLASFTMFTVCQDTDTVTEKVIISIENDSAPEMVLTNKRMAALDVYRYANYSKNKNLIPKIYAYSQNKSKDSSTISHKLQLGRPPRNQNLPVAAYKGIVPELILFNRFLSYMERQKVESYLAIKYGISLNQTFPVSYFNSKGEIIWNGEIHAKHNQNIAGIGRDDASGLNQKVSESIQTPGVLKIGHRNDLKNNTFLIWGDNGKALRFADGTEIRPLQREWEIVVSNSINDSVFAETDVMSMEEINPFSEKETCWLMIDRSGTGKFPFKQTDYIPCQPMASSRGSIYFKQIAIDTDHSGSDIFTLLAAPDFFTRSQVISPTCSKMQAGVIQTDIAGGVPPYILILKGLSNPGFQKSAKEYNIYHNFEDISQGSYILHITDANNNIYTENIWVSNSHIWETKISENYTLIEGGCITLDASKGMPAVNYTYSWTSPDGTVLNDRTINITKPGSYLLSITDENNCNSTMEIMVKQTGKANIKYVELFPNPTDGWFAIRIDLERAASVNVTISDISGKIIKHTLLKNERFYWYTDRLQKPGIYFITLIIGNEKESLKLVVQ